MKPDNETCVQCACFFLPFFESGEWRSKTKSPWHELKKHTSSDMLHHLADYTANRIHTTASLMSFLQSIHNDWEITVKKDGILLETETLIFENILPRLEEAGFTENDYILYSEYTRKWGML